MSANVLTQSTVKLSSLENAAISPARVIAPIEADTVLYEPPPGLMVAGFAWSAKVDESAEGGFEISEDLVDTVIAWSTIGNNARFEHERIECVLELDYKQQIPAAQVAQLAGSGEFSLALCGWDGSPEGSELYMSSLKGIALEMLAMPSFTRRFYPFSICFEWIFLEQMGKVDDAATLREQAARGMVDVIHPSGARIEYALRRASLCQPGVEAACKQALLEHFGSEQALRDLAAALSKPIAKRMEGFTQEIKARPKPKVYARALGEQLPSVAGADAPAAE